MRAFAHRGCAAQHPENTLAAFRQTAPELDGIECDVRRCGSGELVVIHDAELDRVTDGTGRVADVSYNALRELDVLGSGEGIPLLSEVFEAVPADCAVNVELKETGIAADTYEILDGVDHEVIVSSFDETTLREADAAGFDALAFLCWDAEDAVATASDLDCEYLHPHWRLCVDSDLVARAHDHGLAVNAWTLETSVAVAQCRDAGVDGVIVDRDDVL